MDPTTTVIIAWARMEKSRGFTYLEIIIVMLILGIIATLGGSSYIGYNSRKQIETETQKLVSYFDLAQTKTLAGEPLCGTYAGNYIVSSATVGDDISLSLTPNGCSAQATYVFPTGYSLPEGDFTLTYNAEGTGVTGASCILLQHPKAELCGKVTIEPSGAFSDQIVPLSTCTCP